MAILASELRQQLDRVRQHVDDSEIAALLKTLADAAR